MRRKKPWYMYVVRCSDNSLYAGISTDVKRRVNEHNHSDRRGAKYTRSRRPVYLVYQQECRDKSEAMVSEIGFKRMRKQKKEEFILSRNTVGELDDVLLADGFEEALMGIAEQFTHPPVAVYDKEKCIQILIDRDGMSHTGAEEFFEFNVQGAWVGERTPIFFTPLTRINEEWKEMLRLRD